MGQYLLQWQQRWLRGHKKKDTARGKTGKFGYSPLYESVGLISIKLSSPPFPAIRCIVSPSCVQASLNGPPIHQSVPSQMLFRPVSHAGTLGRPPSESSSRETPQLTDQASWQASLLPPRTADCRITSARSGGGVVRRSGLTPPANGWARPAKQTLNRGAFVLGHVTPQRIKGKVQMRRCC